MKKRIRQLKPVFDKQNRFIFFGNHKAGLTSIIRYALKDRVISWKQSKEIYNQNFSKYSLDDIKKMFKFTVVRNPFDRVVSAFFYLRKYQLVSEKRFHKSSKKENNIAAFRYFIKNDFKEKGVSINGHFHPMFMYAEYVDFIGRLENIEHDWKIIADKIQSPIKKLQKRNVINHKIYSLYYDTECIKIVTDIYDEDLKMFGYKFKGNKK